jgi:hypothetical protein
MRGQVFRRRPPVGQRVAQGVLRVVLGCPDVSPTVAVPRPGAGQVERGIHEEAPGPRLEPVSLAQRVELVAADKLHERGLDCVL